MKQTALLLLLLCGPGLRALSLPDARKLMLERNHDLAMARAVTAAADYQIDEAWAAWHPSVAGSASYAYQSQTQHMSLSLNLPFVGDTTMEQTVGDHDRVEVGIDVQYPFFTGLARVHNVKGKKLEKAAQEQNVESLKRALSFQLGLTYFFWELAVQRVETQEALVRQLSEQETQTANRLAAGAATAARLADARARSAQAQSDLLTARNQADSLELEVALLTGDPAADLTVEPYVSPQPDSSVALDPSRPELRSQELLKQKLSEQEKALLSRYLPTLGGFFGLRYANPGINLGSDEFMGYNLVGVSASWQFYDGLKTRALRRQARTAQEIADRQRDKVADSFEAALARSRLRLAAARNLRLAAEASLAAAEALVQDLANAVAAGTATQADYLNALTTRAQAQFAVYRCDFEIKAASLMLSYAAGKDIEF